MERPPLPGTPTPSEPRKVSFLDRVFHRLPAGSRRIAGAMALGAMEVMSDKPDTEQFEALSQANEIVQEERQEQAMRDTEAEEAVLQTEKIEELRNRIRGGSNAPSNQR